MPIQVLITEKKQDIKDVMGVKKEPDLKEVYEFIIDVGSSYGDFPASYTKSKIKFGQPYKGKIKDLFHPELLKEIEREKELFDDILDSMKVAVEYYNKRVSEK